MQQVLRDLDDIVNRHISVVQHRDDVGPSELRLPRDVGGQPAIEREARRSGCQQPACIGGRFDGIAVVSDLPGDADVVALVLHYCLHLWSFDAATLAR